MKSENIINLQNSEMKIDDCRVSQFESKVSSINSFDIGSKLLYFKIKELPPSKFSCP